MKTADIRDKFLQFFKSQQHTIVDSSPLIPAGDPTLLFTNSGMVQFKDVFLGLDKRPYHRATTAQRSLRAGGKHNDLENVGYTARHHTFFEMLGNFSFGDYFKKEAIHFAWTLLTDVYKLPPEKLWVTVYHEDDEAYNLWKDQIGVPAERIIRIGDNKGARYASDNFWQMADTGPCGPCSEIFYDHGEGIYGGPPGSPEEDGDRYIEIWNLVFMQFNRDDKGVLHPLPKPSVDTGMGLERISAVLQGVHSNYDIDIFQTLISAAARETKTADRHLPSLKVLADHIRACSFMVVDGIIPGNEGRGYVLRRIIRRAIRHGYKLGARSPFFHRMVPDLVAEMGIAYPDLANAKERVIEVIGQEEERFFATIEHGMTILESEINHLNTKGEKILSGETAFKLHDTYGFPLDLTADVCREKGLQVDDKAFDSAMARQKAQARASGKFKMSASLEYKGAKTQFSGYEQLESKAKIVALYRDGVSVPTLTEGEMGVVVLDNTPFYAESGGQVGDNGLLQVSGGKTAGIFSVEDTQKIQPEVFGHHGVLSTGTINVGDSVVARVDGITRTQTMRHHSATHLLHKALREVLGSHVAQKGSQVDSEKTRFDFSHNQPMTDSEIREVEQRVNAEILANSGAEAKVMGLEEAKQSGAMMLFGEKYGDEVRVLTIGSSKELCGGTHVSRTGDIGPFCIVAETGVASGVRRVEAVAGSVALAYINAANDTLTHLSSLLKTPVNTLPTKISQLIDEQTQLQKLLKQLQQASALGLSDSLLAKAISQGNVSVLIEEVPSMENDALRSLMDKLRDSLAVGGKEVAIVLSCKEEGKATMMVALSKGLSTRIKAGDIAKEAAVALGGKGGGRPDFAQAGGAKADAIPEALKIAESFIHNAL